MKSFFARKIALGYLFLSILGSVIVTYLISDYLPSNSALGHFTSPGSSEKMPLNCTYDVKRLNGYNYIKPLMFVDNECESEELFPIKQRVNTLIGEFKASGDLISASVYLKLYSKNGWMGINENEKFSPGSLMKVPVLITFLKMNEKNPGLLNKSLSYDHLLNSNKTAAFVSNQIQLGHRYTVKELLTYMIAYSDNNATNLLNTIIDINAFKKIFTDFGLDAPDWKSNDYPISSKDYSLFMRSLYNASYLTIEDSEFATELLAHSDFKNGLIKNLPEFVKKAHKFGEGGSNLEPELSETAFIYLENKPYLLTVMTKGKDNRKLAQIISQISDIIYQSM
ncbi:MAG: serine hydrolase [Mariniphaga sp.]